MMVEKKAKYAPWPAEPTRLAMAHEDLKEIKDGEGPAATLLDKSGQANKDRRHPRSVLVF